jgi:hypothetical protein
MSTPNTQKPTSVYQLVNWLVVTRMTWIEIRRPSNRHVLARFEPFTNYRYRLPDGTELPLRVQYAWCARCDAFIEAEDRYTEDEILDRIARLDVDSPDLRAWQTALDSTATRQTPSRCLSCGSVFAITPLQSGKEIAHPNGDGTIIVSSDGMLGSDPYIPPPTYFDHEGLRVASSNTENDS